jgi:quinol monooxygenase YgiN
MTVTLIATFTALPGRREVVAGLISDFADVVRQEPGNIVFDPFTAADAPDDFVVYEQYADEDAFQAHLANPAGAEFNERLVENIVGDGSVLQFLDAVHAGH